MKSPSVRALRPNSRASRSPAPAAAPLTATAERPVSRPLRTALRLVLGPAAAIPMNRSRVDTQWTDGAAESLREEFGDVYAGRTCLVTGADGFMGSHLTEALVLLGASVHAFVRATSSGALNNIGQLRGEVKVHFADLTDRTSVDYLVRELCEAPDRPYVFHLGAQAHVGESWHRPYETLMANTFGTLNLLQSIVDHGLELEKFDTAGTSEEYGNPRKLVEDHHTWEEGT